MTTHSHEVEKTLALPRVLGFMDVIGILVGTVIGSGIFIVPAAMAAEVKSPVLMLSVWLVGGVLSFFGALTFSELGAMYPAAGGMYVYLREAYGRLIAFLFGWAMFFVIEAGSVATLAMAFSSKYLTYFIPLSPVGIKIVALLFCTVLATINYLGTRWGARVQNLLTFIKFGAIVGVSVVVLGFGDGTTANWTAPAADLSPGMIGPFGVALVASLWAYKGWEAATFSAGEIRNPERTLPLGLFAGTLLCVGLYIVANLAYLYVLPIGAVAASSRIAADAMGAAVGPVSATIVSAVILFSITGAANGNFLTAPRVFFAMSRDGLFFSRIADVHPKFLTPYVSIIALWLWSAVLSLSGTFEQLAAYVVFGQWIFFGLTVAAVIVLRKKQPDLPRPYKTWGYPVTPILFILAALYISVNQLVNQFGNAMAGLGIIALGLPAYWWWNRGKAA
jgi:APA family basic amino acid/polyamine antiporter